MSDLLNYVIAISSVSGGGKTTLVKRTTDLLKGTALFSTIMPLYQNIRQI
jgi:uridine kinase